MEISNFISDVARGAGEIVMRHHGHVGARLAKGDKGDFATEADLQSEAYAVGRIRSAFPDHAILSEEAGCVAESTGGYIWLIDPLDGTRNYASGIPFFSVSIALVKDGVAEYGAVYDPLHDELFSAAAGQGASVNGNPIHVSTEPEIEDAVISISWLRRRADTARFVGYVERISHRTSYYRRLGSAALTCAYAATGRLDAYIQGGIGNWDIAAGTLLIREAGGAVSDFDGKPIDLRDRETDILAANQRLHGHILREIIGTSPA